MNYIIKKQNLLFLQELKKLIYHLKTWIIIYTAFHDDQWLEVSRNKNIFFQIWNVMIMMVQHVVIWIVMMAQQEVLCTILSSKVFYL